MGKSFFSPIDCETSFIINPDLYYKLELFAKGGDASYFFIEYIAYRVLQDEFL